MSIKVQRIYIAGALSSKEKADRDPSSIIVDYISNVSAMCKAASAVMRKGHCPYVPCLDLLLGVVDGDWEEDDYRTINLGFLKVCDAVLVISKSFGVEQEVKLAKSLGLKIYSNIGEVPYAGEDKGSAKVR